MKKILLNGLQYESNGAGISKYTQKLLEQFLKDNYDIDILMRNEFKQRYTDDRIICIDSSVSSSTKRILEEQVIKNKLYKQYGLVHFPDYATPVFFNGAKVATIHDMAMYTMSDKYTFMQNLTKKTLLEQSIKHAKRLICVSEFSKQELLKYYPYVEDKTRVIYEGVDIPDRSIQDNESIECLYQLHIQKPFILYVGTIAPHKNIDSLIKAFAKLKQQGYEHQLVIAGKKGWMYEEVFRSVTELGLDKDIIFTGFITDRQLEVLYRKAECFITVSLYEGFGFPPLEAMGRGCPVIVSDLPIFHEICRDNVLYCNPKDINHIAKIMIELLTNHNLRQTLVHQGKKHIEMFRWEKVARQTYEVYSEVLLQERGIEK